MNSSLAALNLAFQKTPIILVDGIASAMGGYLPIIAITEGLSIAGGLLTNPFAPPSPTSLLNMDNFFADFSVVPGGTLVDNEIAKYPFANMQTAANAIVGQPLRVSLRMVCPPRKAGSMLTSMLTFSGLKSALDFHNFNGGTYIVMTPQHIYRHCLLAKMTDITTNEKIPQSEWKFDFEAPLISVSSAVTTYNALMGKIAAGAELGASPSWSSLASGAIA